MGSVGSHSKSGCCELQALLPMKVLIFLYVYRKGAGLRET
jgi:hypothetical protein